MRIFIASSLVIAALLGLTPAGHAHPHPGMGDTTFVRPLPPPGPGPLLWSLAGTVIPQAIGFALLDEPTDRRVAGGMTLIAVAVSVGPALGYYAGGRPDRSLPGMLLRGGVTAVAIGVAYGGRGGRVDPLRDLPGAIAAGYAIAGASAALDIARLRARLNQPSGPLLDVVPGPLPSNGAALAVRVRF